MLQVHRSSVWIREGVKTGTRIEGRISKRMACCCCSFGATAEQQFDARVAARDLNRYRKKGPAATTRLLGSAVAEHLPPDASLLDIGCGVGALTFELLGSGVHHAIGVDASSAYLAAASEEAVRRGRSEALRLVHGDFLNA